MGIRKFGINLFRIFLFEFNTTLNSSTGYTPYELMFGRKASIPVSIYNTKDLGLTFDDYNEEMKKIFADMHRKAKQNLISSKEKRKEIYDRKAKDFKPFYGDLVLVEVSAVTAGSKLQSNWRGPYEVVELPSEQTTVIKNGNKLEKVHNNRLKKFH